MNKPVKKFEPAIVVKIKDGKVVGVTINKDVPEEMQCFWVNNDIGSDNLIHKAEVNVIKGRE